MSQKIKDLIERRNRVVVEARGILDKAQTEKRSLTAEEDEKWNELIKEQDNLSKSIEQESRQLEIERSLAQSEFRGTPAGKETASGDPRASEEYRSAFMKLICFGADSINIDEKRALQADTQTTGGFLLMPLQMVDALIKAADNAVIIRNKATKFQISSAHSLGAPSLDTDPDDADWTAELGTGNEDSSMALGRRELKPHALSKRIKVSNRLLRMLPAAESLVISRLGYKFGVAQEKAFMSGNGAGQPLGIFTASNDGIPTSRDVSTGNSATDITFDGLIEAKYSVKEAYMRIAEWIFHRDAVKKLAKLKDGEGQYIWQPSKRDSEPDMLLGRPFNMSEYAPNTFTSGQYAGIFGDFSQYWIADALDMQVQRLVELYAATNQTGLIGRMETDGMPVLAEAFARVKLGS